MFQYYVLQLQVINKQVIKNSIYIIDKILLFSKLFCELQTESDLTYFDF
jgi:hypothetical protein